MMIEGVKNLPVNTYVDDRGYLTQIVQESDSAMPPIKRIYVTGNFSKGIIRGYHKHSREWKGFFVPSGAAKFVLVDDRKESKTYKKIDTFVMSPASPSILVIPTGVYNGWMSLADNTIVMGISSDVFDRNNPDDERIPPDAYGDVWTVKGR
jgi:dTDP-4-dehydrorhamnose 3,5-epimerase-like enzyme